MSVSHPYPAHSFRVEIDGLTAVAFNRIVLPSLERDVIRYRDGSDLFGAAHKLPGLLTVGDCVLEHGTVPTDTSFFQWITGASSSRRNVSITLLDASHVPVLRWLLHDTFAIGLEWSPLDAQHSSALIERLRLAVERVDLQSA
jgi:phage tail-like protein